MWRERWSCLEGRGACISSLAHGRRAGSGTKLNAASLYMCVRVLIEERVLSSWILQLISGESWTLRFFFSRLPLYALASYPAAEDAIGEDPHRPAGMFVSSVDQDVEWLLCGVTLRSDSCVTLPLTCAEVSPGSHVINANLKHRGGFPYRHIFTCVCTWCPMWFFSCVNEPRTKRLLEIIVSAEAIMVMVTYTVTLAFNVNLRRTAKTPRN